MALIPTHGETALDDLAQRLPVTAEQMVSDDVSGP
jgi:hypothetical protein